MGITVKLKIDGLVRRLETMAEQEKDLERPLRMFGGYLRKRALARVEAQGFPPLAKATLEARASKGLHQLGKKLETDVRKAKSRAKGGEITRGVVNRLSVLAEFQRNRLGALNVPHGILRQTGLKALTLKQKASLAGREGRAIARQVMRPILGNLPRTFVVEVEGATVRLIARTHVKFSEIHNEGGQAGRGARIPKREFLVLEDKDEAKLAEILKDQLLKSFED